MNYLPFDYEIAKDNIDRVITRDGKQITELCMLKTTNTQPVVIVIDGRIETRSIGGSYLHSENQSDSDLFLLPEKKVVYQNVYADYFPSYAIGENTHKTLDSAIAGNRGITSGKNTAVAVVRLTFFGDTLESVSIVHRYNQ